MHSVFLTTHDALALNCLALHLLPDILSLLPHMDGVKVTVAVLFLVNFAALLIKNLKLLLLSSIRVERYIHWAALRDS